VNLERPLVWLDYETTGKRPATARVVQFGMIKMVPDGTEREVGMLINPTIPIPPSATATHGITDEMVKDAPTFASIARRIVKTFEGCDFGGYNVRYDLEVTAAELAREGIQWNWDEAKVVDGFRLWQVAQPRSLEDAMRDLLGERLEDAHDAVADVRASRRVVHQLLQLYPQLGSFDVARLHELAFPKEPDWVDRRGKIYWEGTEAAISFGKHKGVLLRDLPRSYMVWMVKPGTDFPADVKQIIREALDGRFPVYQEEEPDAPVAAPDHA
jgi:DNA polymerase-3 subunit epsilon